MSYRIPAGPEVPESGHKSSITILVRAITLVRSSEVTEFSSPVWCALAVSVCTANVTSLAGCAGVLVCPNGWAATSVFLDGNVPVYRWTD